MPSTDLISQNWIKCSNRCRVWMTCLETCNRLSLRHKAQRDQTFLEASWITWTKHNLRCSQRITYSVAVPNRLNLKCNLKMELMVPPIRRRARCKILMELVETLNRHNPKCKTHPGMVDQVIRHRVKCNKLKIEEIMGHMEDLMVDHIEDLMMVLMVYLMEDHMEVVQLNRHSLKCKILLH